ncbi:hypothetical protein [Aureimonas jatrophae]|uniref:Uncharacterized protein n=1 Tax=Aureimonas jatrophae TaxID=1166073 RepID=A0A1H0L6P5_9HYPH|nr:hypothetical protein [Aureimonas jatrophae]MBB3952428.1 hypothetical protein [Aureimonas jatrophae]SDO63765.1 hypothetical protein SAMN05192530_10961 [Aureimonas jatrophae]
MTGFVPIPRNGAPESPDPSWISDLRDAERSGFQLQLKVRATVLALLTGVFVLTTTLERALTYAAFFAALVLVGWIVDRLVSRLPATLWRVPAAILIVLDVVVLSVTLASPNLLPDYEWPPQVALRFSSFLYLPLYVMGSALTTSPLLVLWTGMSAAFAWSVCVWWTVRLPDTVTVGSARIVDTDLAPADQLRIWLDPHFVSEVGYQSQVLDLLVSEAVFLAAQAQGVPRETLERFAPPRAVPIRGRLGSISVCALRSSDGSPDRP